MSAPWLSYSTNVGVLWAHAGAVSCIISRVSVRNRVFARKSDSFPDTHRSNTALHGMQQAWIEPLGAYWRLNGLGASVWHEDPMQQSAWFVRGAGCWPRESSDDPRVCRLSTSSVKIAAAHRSRPAESKRSRFAESLGLKA